MRKIIDERGRIFGKVSIIDALVLVVIVIVLIAAYARFNVVDSPTIAAETHEVTYTVLLPAIRESNALLLRRGDTVFSTDSGVNIGRIVDIYITPAYNPEPLIDGTNVIGKVYERYDVILTVVTQASISDGRVFADRAFELNENADNRIHTKFNEFSASVILSIHR